MSAASSVSSAEQKSASSVAVAVAVSDARAAAVYRWTARLKPALDAALLPELIRLTAEYLSVGYQFSRRLTAPLITIEDADEDGSGRTLRCGSATDWQLSWSDGPLSALADAKGRALWFVQHMSGSNATYGVGVPDPARLFTGLYGAGPQQWGLYVQEASRWCAAHDHGQLRGKKPTPLTRKWPPPDPICFTTDLTANCLTVEYEEYRWDMAVPDLNSKHIYFAMALGRARLRLRRH